MADQAQTNAATPVAGMRSEIGQKWSKLSAAEIAALKSTDELVTHVQSKYAVDRSQAQKDVDSFAKGRAL